MTTSYAILIPYTFKIVRINSSKYLVCEHQNSYFQLPHAATILCNEKCLTFFAQKNFHTNFFKKLQNLGRFLDKVKTHYSRRLKFKGLGLKYHYNIKDSLLELKLGFSHIIKIKINQFKLSLKLLKHTIIFSSMDKVYLGNFLYRLKKLKMPNVYKGKGLLYKREKIKLKPIKKK